MPVDVDGVKYACAGCIAGHRATSCPHWDRWMLRVRNPGRPLTTCPHAGNDCPCVRTKVMMMKIFINGKCFCAPDPDKNARPKDEDKPKKKKTPAPRNKARASVSSSRTASESAGPSPKADPDTTSSDVVHASIETALQSDDSKIGATAAAHQGFGSCCSSKKAAVPMIPTDTSVPPNVKQITPATSLDSSVSLNYSTMLNTTSQSASGMAGPAAKRRRLSETPAAPQTHGCGTSVNHIHTAITQPISLNGLGMTGLEQPIQPSLMQFNHGMPPYTPGVFNYVQPGMPMYNAYVVNPQIPVPGYGAIPQAYSYNLQPQLNNFGHTGMARLGNDQSGLFDPVQTPQPLIPTLDNQQNQDLAQATLGSFDMPTTQTIAETDSWDDAYLANPLLEEETATFDQQLSSPAIKDEFTGGFNDSMAACSCGDLCACMGCPVHPFNDTTTTMVRNLYNIMEADFAAEEAAKTLPTPGSPVGALASPGFDSFPPGVFGSPVTDTRPGTSNGMSPGLPLPIPDYGNYQFVFQWCQGTDGDICGCPEGECECPGCLTHGNPPASEQLGDPAVPSKTVTMDGPSLPESEDEPTLSSTLQDIPAAIAPPKKKSCCGGG